MSTTGIDLLRGIPLVAKMSDAELAALSQLLQTKTYDANQPIFWMGDAGTDFFIIRSGKIALSYVDEDGKEKHLATLGPGQFFGELSLFDGGKRTATARCTEPSELLSLGRADFEQFLISHPAASFHILVVLGRRQREMLDQLRGIKNVNQVVAEKTSRWHRASDVVTQTMASPYFIAGEVAIMLIWILINHLQGNNAFDAYPFSLLSLVVSVEALFLSTFLLVSQGKQSDRDRVRADLDYQVNLKAHMEVMQLHQKVDKLESLLRPKEPDPKEN
jgi:CRP/FNR family transcriptional regulator, cyclic AMP receptor protein